MQQTTETAFVQYEAARQRLPAARPPGESLYADSLEDIADRFDVFLLDAFGVLNIGEEPIPQVSGRIERLRDAGKRVMVLTNAAGRPKYTLVEKYRRLGYDFAAEDIVSSRATLIEALASEPDRHWGVMIADSAELDDLAKFKTTRLGEEPEPYRAVDGILLLGSADWTEARQRMLENAIAERPRPVWVGNPDIVAPREDGFSAEPGCFAHRLADRTQIEPKFFGKPFRNIFDLAFGQLGDAVEPSRTLMVGDSLHTDVLGAQAIGVATALVSGFGFFAGHPVGRMIERSGICPDIVLARP